MSILLTERAAAKVRHLFIRHNLAETACLRVGLKGGGCEGFSYTLDVTDRAADDDETFVSHDVRLVCDPKSYPCIQGTEIDYDDSPATGGFVFRNPNARSSCGCGMSFST